MKKVLAGVVILAGCLNLGGCSWAALKGEEGYEYSFRFAPITQTDAEQHFDSKTIRFGTERSEFRNQK